jgi:hypothetical protein
VTWQSTEGLVSQLHPHTFTAKDTSGTDLISVPNDSVTPYYHTGNLFDITKDSTGTTITNNRYFNLVFWGVANKTGDFDLVMCNLPSGFYAIQSEAEIDAQGYDNYDFPREFDVESGTAFLIARATFKMGATWTHILTTDLRGRSPSKTSGGTGISDHGSLGGLTDDDHAHYSLVSGARPFTGTVGGVTPVADSDLATKAYVDGSGGTTTVTNGDTISLVIGTPVRVSAGDSVVRAQASDITKARVFALVKEASVASSSTGKVIFSGVLEATTVQWDAVTGGSGGLTPGSKYYLSTTIGQLTDTAVSAAGDVCTEVGTALSTTELKVEIRRTIEL